ncbi:MAG: type II secretion system F family protein [Candidatus Levybacteria bacterium]|nr:type II secretion system F family protein [Candidatus Levybacteria bacterium]
MKSSRIRLSTNEKIGFVKNLHTMLSAGIPILEVIDSLLEDSKGGTKAVLLALKEDLSQGKHMYYSFDKFPKIFDKVTVSIIKTAEESGTLDVALKDMTENIKKDAEFRDKVKGAMLYPLVIMVVFIIVFFVLLVVVIPKISEVFERLHVVLPLPTKILIFISHLLLDYTIPFIIIVISLIVGVFIFYKMKREIFVKFLFALPLISKLAVQIDLTKFSRSMYLLLNAGITINDSLTLCQEVVAKNSVKKTIIHAKETVLAGKKMSLAFKSHKSTIPVIMIKIIEAGEKSGTLDKSMQDISEYLDYQVSKTLKTVTTLMEPLMLVVVSVLIGGMMMAIIAPIYGLIGQVGNR